MSAVRERLEELVRRSRTCSQHDDAAMADELSTFVRENLDEILAAFDAQQTERIICELARHRPSYGLTIWAPMPGAHNEQWMIFKNTCGRVRGDTLAATVDAAAQVAAQVAAQTASRPQGITHP